ncbi:MAG: aminotransferase class IV [Opitutaceae bacterium]
MTNPKAQHYVLLNGALCLADAARVSPLSDAFMYGAGLFETIKVKQGKLAFFHEHARRLFHGAAELGLSGLTDAGELAARCARLVASNGLGEGSLKIVIFQDAGGIGELILTSDRVYKPAQYDCGFKLRTVPDARHPRSLSGLKTLNYLKNLGAKRAASQDGFDEALFVGADGTVWEGATSNVFMVKAGVVSTPAADACILPGIGREKVLGLLKDQSACEASLSVSQLMAADEVFVTNALLGVMPVKCIDQREYDTARNPITRAIMTAYAELGSTS